MVIRAFPPVEHADKRGLLAVGGDLEVDSLLLAYTSGIFPWPIDDSIIPWFAPPKRAVLFFDELHISRSLARTLRKKPYTFAVDKNFEAVIEACAEVRNRGHQDSTWITPSLMDAYIRMHYAGYCSSYETYIDGDLVGGLFGIRIGRFCTGESMFYRKTDASKVALVGMVEHLRGQGVSWMDCQVLTPVTTGFGAREIPRREYMKLLEATLSEGDPSSS